LFQNLKIQEKNSLSVFKKEILTKKKNWNKKFQKKIWQDFPTKILSYLVE